MSRKLLLGALVLLGLCGLYLTGFTLIPLVHKLELLEPSSPGGSGKSGLRAFYLGSHIDGSKQGKLRRASFLLRREERRRFTPQQLRDRLLDWLLLALLHEARILPWQRSQMLATDAGARGPFAKQRWLSPCRLLVFPAKLRKGVQIQEVLALIPAGPQQRMHLEKLAHALRLKSDSESLEHLEITPVSYRLDLPRGRATWTQHPPVRGSTLLQSPRYIVQTITQRKDLEGFLQKVHDLTYASLQGSRLVLGGRAREAGKKPTPRRGPQAAPASPPKAAPKLPRYRGPAYRVSLRDLADLWRSEGSLTLPRRTFAVIWGPKIEEFKRRWQSKAQDFHRRWKDIQGRYNAPADASLVGAFAFVSTWERWVQTRLKRLKDRANTPQSWRHKERLWQAFWSRLKLVAAHLKLGVLWKGVLLVMEGQKLHVQARMKRQYRALKARIDAALKRARVPAKSGFYLRLHKAPDKAHLWRPQFDGKLAGTEVGMMLFALDLFAKIQVVQQLHDDLRGKPFRCELLAARNPRLLKGSLRQALRLDLRWAPHRARLSRSLWNDHSRTLLMAPHIVRLDPAYKGLKKHEIPPFHARFHRLLRRWRACYHQKLADTPAFRLLNQLTKWGLLMTWLARHKAEATLSFLNAAPEVSPAFAFDAWLEKQQRVGRWSWQRDYLVKGPPPSVKASSLSHELFGRELQVAGGISLGGAIFWPGPLLRSLEQWKPFDGISLPSIGAWRRFRLPRFRARRITPLLYRPVKIWRFQRKQYYISPKRGLSLPILKRPSALLEHLDIFRHRNRYSPDARQFQRQYRVWGGASVLGAGPIKHRYARLQTGGRLETRAGGMGAGLVLLKQPAQGKLQIFWRPQTLQHALNVGKIWLRTPSARALRFQRKLGRYVAIPERKQLQFQLLGSSRWLEAQPIPKAARLEKGWLLKLFGPKGEGLRLRWISKRRALGSQTRGSTFHKRMGDLQVLLDLFEREDVDGLVQELLAAPEGFAKRWRGLLQKLRREVQSGASRALPLQQISILRAVVGDLPELAKLEAKARESK